jgi:hypothetical protein
VEATAKRQPATADAPWLPEARETFESVLEARLQADEMTSAVQGVEIEPEVLRSRALERRDEVVGQVAPEFEASYWAHAALQRAQQEHEAASSAFESPEVEPAESTILRVDLSRLLRWLRQVVRPLFGGGRDVAGRVGEPAQSTADQLAPLVAEVERRRSEFEAAEAQVKKLLSPAIDEVLRTILDEKLAAV